MTKKILNKRNEKARRVFDSHIHIHFEFDRSVEQAKELGLNYSPQGLIKDMKRHNIEKALIMGTFSNKYARDFAQKYAPHFLAAATLNPVSINPKEFDFVKSCLSNKEFSGIKMYPGYIKFYPYEKKCDRIYKLAMKYDVPVVFHSGDPAFPGAPVKYCHPIHLDDVACKFPDLKIIIAHLGFPWITDTMEVIIKNPNAYSDISGLFAGGESPYKEKMKARLRTKIEDIVYSGGGDKLLFGTDYALASHDEYIKFAKGLKISSEDLDKLLFSNAAKLFPLK